MPGSRGRRPYHVLYLGSSLHFESIATDDQEGADRTLIYMLAHDGPEAANASWKSFLEDPVWIAAKAASQEGIGKLIIEKGINRTYLNPLDFSPMK
jgi:hypothetical protein